MAIEGVYWRGKHTQMDWNMKMTRRVAITPDRKDNYENLPYTQGDEDFSDYEDTQYFHPREIEYTFVIRNVKYSQRKGLTTNIQNWLKGQGRGILLDDHDKGFYYEGKFTKVYPEDEHTKNKLTIVAIFRAQPFKIGLVQEGNHYIDDMNLSVDVFQKTFFEVKGVEREIKLYNNSTNAIIPAFRITGNLEIENDNVIVIADETSVRSEIFRLKVGMNYILLRGTGTIKFLWAKELL